MLRLRSPKALRNAFLQQNAAGRHAFKQAGRGLWRITAPNSAINVAAKSICQTAQGAQDVAWMQLALDQAIKGAGKGEVPVGAVLVHNGQHAAAQQGGWRLLQSSLYVTLEPCPMCAGAMLLSRVGTVIYGTNSPLLGADGSWVSLFPCSPSASNSQDQVDITEGHAAEVCLQQPKDPQGPFALHPNLQVRRHVLQEQCSHVLQQFFKRRRLEPSRFKS